MGNKLSRRKLVSLFGAAGTLSSHTLFRSPIAFFLANTTTGLLYKSAHGAPSGNRKWVDFRCNGAPPRWVYDLFLNPLNQSIFAANPQVGTRYVETQGRFTDVEYATYAHQGLHLPWMWQFPLPVPGGGTRPMTDLLANMLQIRGIDTNNASHQGSEQKHFGLPSASQSTAGLSADASDSPFAAVMTSPMGGVSLSSALKSSGNKVATIVSGTNLVQSMLDPFLTGASDRSASLRVSLRDHLNAVSTEINEQAIAGNTGLYVSQTTIKSVEQIMGLSLSNLVSEWDTLVAKYRDLIARVINPTNRLLGINNLPIGVIGATDGTHRIDNTVRNLPDLAMLIDQQTTIVGLAEHFSLAEYILTKDLSDSITLGSAQLRNLLGSSTANVRFSHSTDEHGTGKIPTLLVNTIFHRCHAACLLELITQLKDKNLFEDVVIRNGSEFNRSPRLAGDGSDHGFRGASMAFYSGAIRSPHIIGNIRTGGGGSSYPGTWGVAAPMESPNPNLNGLIMDFGHTLASIALMLRVPTPITSRDPVVTETAQGIVPTISVGKIV